MHAKGRRAQWRIVALPMLSGTFAGIAVKFCTEEGNWDLVSNDSQKFKWFHTEQLEANWSTIGEKHGRKD